MSSERDEVKERVKAATDLAEWIRRDGVPLVGGGKEWKANCPFHTDKSPSFNVFFRDDHWSFYCHGCEAKGDIFEWVMRRKSITFPEALKHVASAAGIALPEMRERIYNPERMPEGAGFAPVPEEKKRALFDPEKYRALTPGSKPFQYLTEKRLLPVGMLTDYSVGETVDGEAYIFAYKWRPPYWPANRERALFEFCKVVRVDRPDGKKVERRDPPGGKNILFGMDAKIVRDAHAAAGELVICEGEIDAITWAQYGYAAVSVPGGAKYTGWLDHCWDWLQPFRKIHISFDEDAAGRLKVVEVVTRLGIARTDIIRLPLKTEQNQTE